MRNKLYYKFTDEYPEKEGDNCINDYLEEGNRNKSCWFKNLPANIGYAIYGKVIPTTRKLIGLLMRKVRKGGDPYAQNWWAEVHSLSTAKFCPGIHHILDNSILVKSPSDIHITVFKGGSWSYIVPDNRFILLSASHPKEQVTTTKREFNLFEGTSVIKFHLPIHIGLSSSKNTYIYLQPQYHSNLPLRVINGVVHGDYTKILPLNIITTVEDRGEDYDIIIKKGDVLAYIWGPTKMSLTRKKGAYVTASATKFVNSVSYD
jgi:hypothetical protein